MSGVSVIEQFWYSRQPIRWIFWPFSLLLFGLTRLKYFLYRKNLLKRKDCKVPVLVVGNITVGGTGKTPFIRLLTELLSDHGLKLGIVSRGYHARPSSFPHLVSESDSVNTVGDEAFMQYQALKLPMAIDPNRSAAVEKLADEFDLDLIISDDGLQHYQMGRQLEFLMVDGTREFGNRLCIPFGPLREDISRIQTVDIIIQNGGNQIHETLSHSGVPVVHLQMRPLGLVHLLSGEIVATNNLLTHSVNAVCGIGNPDRFFASLAPLCQSFQPFVFPDHHAFTEEDFRALNDDIVVMTEKDAVKCQSFAADHWYYLKVGANIDNLASTQLIQIIQDQISKPH